MHPKSLTLVLPLLLGSLTCTCLQKHEGKSRYTYCCMPVASGPVKQVLRFTFGWQDPLMAVDWCRNVDGADRMCPNFRLCQHGFGLFENACCLILLARVSCPGTGDTSEKSLLASIDF